MTPHRSDDIREEKAAVELPNPADLDPGIRRVVVYLRAHGFRTFASCEGGDGHTYALPTVRLLPDLGQSPDGTRERLARCLAAAGFEAFWTACFYFNQPSPFGCFVQVELWGDPPPSFVPPNDAGAQKGRQPSPPNAGGTRARTSPVPTPE